MRRLRIVSRGGAVSEPDEVPCSECGDPVGYPRHDGVIRCRDCDIDNLLASMGPVDMERARAVFAGPWPEWFTPSKMTPVLTSRVARGLHPFGLELGPPESTCGTCVHLVRREFSKTYLKCDLTKQTRGPATDVRAKWRGCSRWSAPSPSPTPEGA